ncbi:Uncharacterised protein [Escherichia coli]|nr:Uncharacterised protein [Escherichia coli]
MGNVAEDWQMAMKSALLSGLVTALTVTFKKIIFTEW